MDNTSLGECCRSRLGLRLLLLWLRVSAPLALLALPSLLLLRLRRISWTLPSTTTTLRPVRRELSSREGAGGTPLAALGPSVRLLTALPIVEAKL